MGESLRNFRGAQAAALLEEAAEDILAYRHLPLENQRQLHSTNPLERLNANDFPMNANDFDER